MQITECWINDISYELILKNHDHTKIALDFLVIEIVSYALIKINGIMCFSFNNVDREFSVWVFVNVCQVLKNDTVR